MYLAPLNYDRFFKKVFSDIRIAKRFLEDFFEFKIESIEALSLDHKLTNEASLVQFDYRCKVDGKYIIIDMQQWYKHDVIKRFYLYHAANSVLQLEGLPLKNVGAEKKVKDYSGLLPVTTLIWLVDDSLNFTKDYSAHLMLPEDLEIFLKNEKLWPSNNCIEKPEEFKQAYDYLLKKRRELLELLNNDTKDLVFLKNNPLVFAFQKNIVKNLEIALSKKEEVKPYMRWFEFATKTRKKSNTKEDFKSYEKDELFTEIMRKLNHKSLNKSDWDYIYYFEELEGIAEVKWKEGIEKGWKEGRKEGINIGEKKNQKAVATRCLKSGMRVKDSSFISGLTLEEVAELKKELGV